MRFLKIFILLLLASPMVANAKNPSLVFNFPQIAFEGEFTCGLPAPSALNIDEIGADWVQVSWPSVMGASQYRLQSYDGFNGDALTNAIFVPGNTNTAIVSTAGNSGSAYVKIWSVCINGSWNDQNVQLSATFDTIIIDVVATGFSFPNQFYTIPVTVSGVNISWTGGLEYFNVRYTRNGVLYGRRFELRVKSDGSPDVVVCNVGFGPSINDGEHIVFTLEYDTEGNPVGLFVRFRQNLALPEEQATWIATLKAIHPNAASYGKWYRTSNTPTECVIEKVVPFEPMIAPGETGQSSVEPEDAIRQDSYLNIAPNPFHERLTIQLAPTKDPKGTVLHLYDLLGARKMTYVAPADQVECSLNTSRLEPGAYFLRVESEGRVETFRLLKAH